MFINIFKNERACPESISELDNKSVFFSKKRQLKVNKEQYREKLGGLIAH